MSYILQVNKFEWIEDASKVNEEFIKAYNEESEEGSFLGGNTQYPEKLHELHNDFPFSPEIMKNEKF